MEEEGNKHPALIRHVLLPKHGEITCPEIIKIKNALGPAKIVVWLTQCCLLVCEPDASEGALLMSVSV